MKNTALGVLFMRSSSKLCVLQGCGITGKTAFFVLSQSRGNILYYSKCGPGCQFRGRGILLESLRIFTNKILIRYYLGIYG